jgi:DNA polymerase-1
VTHLLIDGDQFVFKACAAVEEEVRWDDQNHVLYSNFEKAWTNLQGMIGRIYDRFGTIDSTMCFSSYPTFRHAIDETYKAGRSRKPLCYGVMQERIWEEYECKAFPSLEADDVMGILATKPGSQQRIIVSQDKDMKTIPATIWDGQDLVTYTETEADYWHLHQTLTGDATDGYKGCPGVGPKKAEKILSREDVDNHMLYMPLWHWVVKTYEKADLTEEHALTQARLARILRWSDWDANKKEPKLWAPST